MIILMLTPVCSFWLLLFALYRGSSFLFLGPTGVGKTELAKALANLLFDDEKMMVSPKSFVRPVKPHLARAIAKLSIWLHACTCAFFGICMTEICSMHAVGQV